MRLVFPLLLLATCSSLQAQGLKWDIPHHGALVYERSDEELAVDASAGPLRGETVIPSTEAGGHRWRYMTYGEGGPPVGWTTRDFDDSGWGSGLAMFGGGLGNDPLVRSLWNTKHLCLRTIVDLGRRKPKAALLRIHHDDGVAVYWNGTRVLKNDGFGRDRLYALLGEDLEAWRRGENLIAAQCTNIGGALYLDVELTLLPQLPRGIRTADRLVEQTRAPSQAAQRIRNQLFATYRSPPILLQGELDATQEQVRMPPADLRDLGWFVAMDLGRAPGNQRLAYEVPRLHRFGDLQLKGRSESADGDGWQVLELQVKSTEPAPRGDAKRFVQMHIARHWDHAFSGNLSVRRRIERRESGARVTEFTAELAGHIGEGKGSAEGGHSFLHRETWQLRQVRANQDAAFRTAVAEAIQKGCEFLRKALAEPEKGDTHTGTGGNRSYGSGRLALALLALIKGGVATDDEVVAKALDSLRRREFVDTYSLGLALMALEASYAPPTEYSDLRTGVIDRPRRRKPSPEDFALMSRWTAQLLGNVDIRDDPTELLRFGYVSGPSFDHSVNQYGLLGLYSAHLCGVEIDPRIWEAGIRHLVAAQCEPGRRIELDLVDYRTHARAGGSAARRTAARAAFPPAGWAYKEPREGGMFVPAYGSMTCSGVAGLALCEAALADSSYRADQRLLNEGTMARMSGLAWIAENLQVRYHPGWMPRQQRWIYYYLYGLERAALLSGIALIQDRDWYFEGAMALVTLQQPDGGWPPEAHADLGLDRAAMAVLFLKKASLPVLTGR